MKKILFTILLLAAAINTYAYDFSAVCSTGQTLYYYITSDSTVQLIFPDYNYSYGGNNTYYYRHQKPIGNIVVPDTVN